MTLADNPQLSDGSHDCQLLGPLGVAVQVAITAVCAAAMLAVWLAESPRRPFITWALDVSKQVVGAAYGKCYNILQAEIFARALQVNAAHKDQCVWYLMGIATDCLVTTFLCWGANVLMRPILATRFGIDIGEYDGEVPVIPTPSLRRGSSGLSLQIAPPSRSQSCCYVKLEEPQWFGGRIRTWLQQLGIWLLIITAVRLPVSLSLFLLQDFLYSFYASVFDLLNLHTATAKTIFAVLLFPAVGDTLQIMIQDRFLKKPNELPLLGLPDRSNSAASLPLSLDREASETGYLASKRWSDALSKRSIQEEPIAEGTPTSTVAPEGSPTSPSLENSGMTAKTTTASVGGLAMGAAGSEASFSANGGCNNNLLISQCSRGCHVGGTNGQALYQPDGCPS
mmetsp:Transcript_48915/g.105353  ORF Transcript_48915/g.105353 Transcript_48915/m.105353 type:complete len:395 (-) Transcript_48915:113-1297(-)